MDEPVRIPGKEVPNSDEKVRRRMKDVFGNNQALLEFENQCDPEPGYEIPGGFLRRGDWADRF